MINKPYYRIIRPSDNNEFYGSAEYILDNNYANDRRSLVHAYHMIENDFKKLFDYIHFHDNNKAVFSHRIYELLLRSCTEFETNCTAILKSNGYSKTGNADFNIKDYFKINQCSRLNEYFVKLNVWSPDPIILQPFKDWTSVIFNPLLWYQAYNAAKHDRNINFSKANLENLLNAIAGVLVVIVSQFNDYSYDAFRDEFMIRGGEFRSGTNSLFSVKRPTSWSNSDYYNFDWNTLKTQTDPFQQFPFV